jgi:tRNA threonylcarbamoyladenosine biosynthesis protein TsaE
MITRNIVSLSTAATEEIGRVIAALLDPGAIVVLEGDLGAGKTALTRGIAVGLGLASMVTSPTYTIVSEHISETGGTDLFHFDVYRLHDSDDFIAAGLDEYFYRGGVCVLEWGDKVEDILPENRIRIELRGNGSRRDICLSYPDVMKNPVDMAIESLSANKEIEI